MRARFDSTPVGHILNVFTNDLMQIDMLLPKVFSQWQLSVGTVLCTLIGTSFVCPQFTPFTLSMLGVCYQLYRTWGNTNIEMRRLYVSEPSAHGCLAHTTSHASIPSLCCLNPTTTY